MIVGSGMLAKAFESKIRNENVIIFASGVSNSIETNDKAFEREKLLLENTILNNKNKKLIYFSTCSIDDDAVKDRLYVKHKLLMEDYISKNCKSYLICRVSNVVGKNGNPNTLINYLYNCILNSIPFQAWINSERNIIDVDDLVYYVVKLDELGIDNQIITVANTYNYKILDIISAIEQHVGVKGVYEKVDKGSVLNIDTSILNNLNIEKPANFNSSSAYIIDVLNKYF